MQVPWRCLNRACGQVTPVATEERENEGKRCVCGSPMRRQQKPAVFSYLNFLREDGLAQPGAANEKERMP
jgi:hypothetical protein